VEKSRKLHILTTTNTEGNAMTTNKKCWKLLTGTYENGTQLKIISTNGNGDYIMIGGDHKAILAGYLVKALNRVLRFV